MEFVRQEVKTYAKDENPISLILHVYDATSEQTKILEKELRELKVFIYGSTTTTVCLSFYSNDGNIYVSRNGHSDRTKGLALRAFFEDFNKKYNAQINFFPCNPLNYFEY
jgi:hypothetical protein